MHTLTHRTCRVSRLHRADSTCNESQVSARLIMCQRRYRALCDDLYVLFDVLQKLGAEAVDIKEQVRLY